MTLFPLSIRPTSRDMPPFASAVNIVFCRNGVVERCSAHVDSVYMKQTIFKDAGNDIFIFGWFPHKDSANYQIWLSEARSATIVAENGTTPTVNLTGPTTVATKRKIRLDEDISSDTETNEG